jgi:succinoglycan biosynthesis transport protein ExoP
MATVNMPNALPLPESMPPAPYSPAHVQLGESAPAMSPGDFWRILKQRKWTAIITFVILYSLVIAATLLIWRYAPAYPAEAFLQLTPPRDPTRAIEEGVDPNNMRLLLATEAQKIAQPSLYQDVLKLDEIKATKFFEWYKGGFDRALEDMKRLVRVTPIPDTQLIKVSIDLKHREEAKLVVEKLIAQYLSKFQSAEANDAQRRLDELKRSSEELSKQIAQKKAELMDFRNQANIPGGSVASSVEVTAIARTRDSLQILEAEQTKLRMTLDALKGVRDFNQLPIPAAMRLEIDQDPVIRLNRAQVDQLEVSIQVLLASGRFGEKHREIMQLQTQRDLYYQKEIQRREELTDTMREKYIDQITNDLQTVTALISQANEQLAAAEAKQRDLDEAVLKFRTMQDDYERLVIRQADLDKLVQEAQLAVDSNRGRPRLSIWQPPLEASQPSRPNFPIYLAGGVVLSLLGAVGMAFLRELTDTAVRTPIDIRQSQLVVLGTIPLIDYEEAEVEDIERATREAPGSLVAEAFRHVKAQLMFSGPTESQRVLLVTAPSPGDGATACAINMAVTFAQSNQRVLLIDCNFRRPALRAAFRNTKPEGLSNVLIGQKKLADVVTHTELQNLDVVTTGRAPTSPAELLGSSYMAELIREAAQTYDRIILDGPPALLVSDSLVLATLADGVVMVARAVSNSKGEVRRAREQIQRVGGRVIGCILNGVQYRAGGYFKQQFREFYDYTSEEAEDQELLGGPTDGDKGKKSKSKTRPRPPADEDDADDEDEE